MKPILLIAGLLAAVRLGAAAPLNLDLAEGKLISCTGGAVRGRTVSDAVAANSGAVYWKTDRLALDGYDRAAIRLSGLRGDFTAKSFALAFRADGTYHFAPYAALPRIADGRAELIFDLGKVQRRNILAVRLFFNRDHAIKTPCGFTVDQVEFLAAAAAANAPTAELSRAALISCRTARRMEPISDGRVNTIPLESGAVLIPLKGALDGCRAARITLGGVKGGFSPAAFALAFRTGNKYEYARLTGKPDLHAPRTVLTFDLDRITARTPEMLRLYFNRDKRIRGPVEFRIESIEFLRSPARAVRPAPPPAAMVDRLPRLKHRRKLDRTWIFPRIQIKYSLFLNYHAAAHRDIWVDRPLELDRSLAGNTRDYDKGGNFQSLRKDAAALLSCADGMGILATSRSYLDRTLKGLAYADAAGLKNFWLPEISPALTDLRGMSGDGDFEFIYELVRAAVRSPSVFRIGGKVVISSYNASALPPEKWVPVIAAMKKAGDGKVLFIAEIRPPFFAAASEYSRNGKKISVATVEKLKAFIRSYLDVADGVLFAGCNHIVERTDDLSSYRFGYDFYRNILLPTLVAVCSEPPYRNKYLGVSAAKGYFYKKNATGSQSEEGTRTLRLSLAAALEIEPDFILMPEWNEANENTHIQPTVYDSYSSRRILNHFRGKTETRDENPVLPNLIVSCRRSPVLGENLDLEVLNLPDARLRGDTVKVRVRLRDDAGRELLDLGETELNAKTLSEKRFAVPTERFADRRCLVPEVTWEMAGRSGRFPGLAAILLDTPPTLNRRYVKQPLRDLAVPQNVDMHWDNAHGRATVTGSLTAPEGTTFASVELLADAVPVTAAGADNEYRDAPEKPLLTLIWNSLAGGRGTLTLRTWRGESESVRDDAVNLAEFRRSEVKNERGVITKELRFTGSMNQFTFRSDRDATLELALDGEKFTVPVADILKYGAYRKVFPGGRTLQLEPKARNYVVPRPLNQAKADFTLSAPLDDAAAVWSVRAITADGRIWNSPPYVPHPPASETADLALWSYTAKRPIRIPVPKGFARTTVYDFAAPTGDMLMPRLPGRGGVRYGALLGGGTHGGGPVRLAAQGDSAPRRETAGDRPALKFDGRDNVLTVPHAALSEQGFSIGCEFRTDHTGAQTLFDAAYTLPVALHCELEAGAISGTFRNRENRVFKFRTPAVVKYGQWNELFLTYDLRKLTVWCNGAVAAEIPCSGLMNKQSFLYFGGVDSPKGPPRFRGLLRELAISNALLKIR